MSSAGPVTKSADTLYAMGSALRWAEFDGGRPSPQLGVKSRIVNLAELPRAVPKDAFVTPDGRRSQLTERAASYAWRLLDH